MNTNAQAALQAAVTLHARIEDQVKDISRQNVIRTAVGFKEWLDEITEEAPEPTFVELSPADRQLLRDLQSPALKMPKMPRSGQRLTS